MTLPNGPAEGLHYYTPLTVHRHASFPKLSSNVSCERFVFLAVPSVLQSYLTVLTCIYFICGERRTFFLCMLDVCISSLATFCFYPFLHFSYGPVKPFWICTPFFFLWLQNVSPLANVLQMFYLQCGLPLDFLNGIFHPSNDFLCCCMYQSSPLWLLGFYLT